MGLISDRGIPIMVFNRRCSKHLEIVYSITRLLLQISCFKVKKFFRSKDILFSLKYLIFSWLF